MVLTSISIRRRIDTISKYIQIPSFLLHKSGNGLNIGNQPFDIVVRTTYGIGLHGHVLHEINPDL